MGGRGEGGEKKKEGGEWEERGERRGWEEGRSGRKKGERAWWEERGRKESLIKSGRRESLTV